MTMLDRMRRHKNWLKWSLALVVLAFMLLYIPVSSIRQRRRPAIDAVATVEGNEVTVAEFRRAYPARCRRTARRTAPTWTSGCSASSASTSASCSS